MPEESESKPKSKHRKSTCAGCRRRKSKCDGKTPKCTTCIAYKDECHYDKPPSLAYVRSLEEENQELKQQLRQLKTQTWLAKTVSNEDRKISPASPHSEASRSSIDRNTGLPHRNTRHVKWETDISVDDQGSVTFHNSTSAVHQAPSEAHGLPSQIPLGDAIALAQASDDDISKQKLLTNASQLRHMEDFAVANTAVKANVPKEVSNELLKYHWCWIHPLFLFVYRPAFIRGMTLVTANSADPPYFSDTLLQVIHAHCARFLNHSVHRYETVPNSQAPVPMSLSASEFMEKMTNEARVSLGLETYKRSSIPTIQALLQQSAREIVFGRSSQGWLYSGMAFRMAFDLGIHLPSDKLQTFVKSLSAEDIEIRKRLFWSCYTWDKIVSLYLGRMPGFTPQTDDVPLTFMDDYSDSDLWAPYYGETPSPDHVAVNYPPCPGYVVSCFTQLCKLCMILNDLMQDIYSSSAATRREDDADSTSGEGKTSSESAFLRISRDLREWGNSLPAHLRVAPGQMPQLAPPVHIMSLNLTYHTTLILLHRPVILGTGDLAQPAVGRSYRVCVDATAAIHDLLVLQANTFGLSHVSYLNAYAAYIAATIAVLRFEREFRPGQNPEQLSKTLGLSFLVDVLQRTAMAMPALERSVAIIHKRMKAVLERQTQSQLNSLFPTSNAPPLFHDTSQQQLDLAQPSGFQLISNSALQQSYSVQNQDPSFAPQQGIPIPWQSNVRSSLISEPTFSEDFLPAFPGQQFPVGTDHSFGTTEVDPQSRAALMAFNLDPYPRLTSGDLDWGFVDAFMSEPQPLS